MTTFRLTCFLNPVGLHRESYDFSHQKPLHKNIFKLKSAQGTKLKIKQNKYLSMYYNISEAYLLIAMQTAIRTA